jgi:hypothetical protein
MPPPPREGTPPARAHPCTVYTSYTPSPSPPAAPLHRARRTPCRVGGSLPLGTPLGAASPTSPSTLTEEQRAGTGSTSLAGGRRSRGTSLYTYTAACVALPGIPHPQPHLPDRPSLIFRSTHARTLIELPNRAHSFSHVLPPSPHPHHSPPAPLSPEHPSSTAAYLGTPTLQGTEPPRTSIRNCSHPDPSPRTCTQT